MLTSASDAKLKFDITRTGSPYDASLPATFTNKGQIYARVGGAQIGVYSISANDPVQPDKVIGRICCHSGGYGSGESHISYIKFVMASESSALLLVAKVITAKKDKPADTAKTIFSLYDIDRKPFPRKPLYTMTNSGQLGKKHIAVAKNGAVFAVRLGKKVQIYSSQNFSKLRAFSLTQFSQVSGLSVSNSGENIAFIGDGKAYVFGDAYSHAPIIHQESCTKVFSTYLTRTGFIDGHDITHYVVNGYGERCVIGLSKQFFIEDSSSIEFNFYYDKHDNWLLLASGDGLHVFDARTGESLGEFLARPHYKQLYGTNDYIFINRYPSYDPDTNTALAIDNYGAFYTIKLSPPTLPNLKSN